MTMRWTALLSVALSLLVFGCFESPSNGGSGTGTGNALSASLVFTDGSSAAYVPVRVRNKGYLQSAPNPYLGKAAAFSWDGVTDGKGNFKLDSLPTGSYVLEANNGHVGLVWHFDVTEKSSKIHLDTLELLGTVTGLIHAKGEIAGPVYVQVEGLQRLVLVNPGSNSFTIKDLPRGEYNLHTSLVAGDSEISRISTVTVVPGETPPLTTLEMARGYPNWKYTANLNLNTTPLGVNIPNNVLAFPMLVRLEGPAFPFNQAAVDGSDLRFTKLDGTPLNFEIERWNRDSLKAEIWVAMDTVYGNSETQGLTMYWGNKLTAGKSAGPAVFDTAKGFQTVWHMREDRSGVGQASLYRDATGHGYNGMDSIQASGKDGIIGLGQEFSGDSDYIHIPHFVTSLSKQSFSISLWFRVDGPGGTILGQYSPDGLWDFGERSLYFGDGTQILPPYTGGQCKDRPITPGRCVNGLIPSFVAFSGGYNISDKAVGVNEWHHLAYTWAGVAEPGKFYLDGTPLGLKYSDLGLTEDSTTFDIYLGKPNGLESIAYFKGWMDEVRISRGVLDANWIRLSFESQRQNSKLLKISIPSTP